MAIKTSTGLAAKLMVGDCAKDIFDGGFIKVYSGAAPATADAAATGTLFWAGTQIPSPTIFAAALRRLASTATAPRLLTTSQ